MFSKPNEYKNVNSSQSQFIKKIEKNNLNINNNK